MRKLSVFLVLVAGTLLLVQPAMAQSDGFAFTGINFNFTNPGARARGIGGAFVAIADDSTAALANPAGLAYLEREFTMEFIHDEDEYPVGQLTQGGVELSQPAPGLFAATGREDPFRVRAGNTSDRLNYASLLLPLKKDRMTLALYYGVLADIGSQFNVGFGVVCMDASGHARLPAGGESCTLDLSDITNGEFYSIYPGQSVDYSMKTEVTGTALGYRLNDHWSVGASLMLGQTKMRGLATAGQLGSVETVTEETLGDDEDMIFGTGILYRADRWGFGLSWRSKSSYDLDNRLISDNGVTEPSEKTFPGSINVPERIAAGLAFFPGENWVISTEVTQISYSQVIEDMRPFETMVETAGIRYRIDDVTEYHLGAEYTTFSKNRGWSLRAGWYRDQTHLPWVREEYSDPVGDPQGDGLRAQESLVRAHFVDDIDHFTIGFGISSGRIRLDAALDWTDQSGVDYLLSGVFYF